MSSISSLEVCRPVLIPNGSALIEEIASMGSKIFDTDGSSAVAIRPTNRTYRTVKIGADYRREEDLSYYHLSIAGVNVKHFGKKIIRARDWFEGNTGSARTSNRNQDSSPDTEALNQTLAYVMKSEFEQDPDDPIEVTIDEVDEVDYPLLYPGKRLFVFRATPRSNRFESGMLRRMSEVAHLALKSHGSSLSDVPNGEIVDTIPFADTRITNEQLRQQFMDNVRELLPVTVLLDSIDYTTRY